MERYLGIIKVFNIIAAVLIVLGVAALVWLSIERAGRGRDAEAVDGGMIALPAGFTITQMAATGDFVLLLVANDAGDTLLLRLDPRDPAASASFVVETARP